MVKDEGASHRAAAEELLLLLKVDEGLKASTQRLEIALKKKFRQSGASEEIKSISNTYINKMIQIYEEELKWEKMKDFFINIYVSTFTENEIREISKFYKSPIGQIYLEKKPKLARKLYGVPKRKVQGFVKKIQKISLEMKIEIKKILNK